MKGYNDILYTHVTLEEFEKYLPKQKKTRRTEEIHTDAQHYPVTTVNVSYTAELLQRGCSIVCGMARDVAIAWILQKIGG